MKKRIKKEATFVTQTNFYWTNQKIKINKTPTHDTIGKESKLWESNKKKFFF